MASEFLKNNFIPRSYQIELLSKSKKKNTIAFLNTGTGKTYIAILLIKEKSKDLRPNWNDGAKRTFFIVNSVPLVLQQGNYVKEHTDLSVGQFTGSMSVDLWKQDEWENQFGKFQVLVMTAQIFLNILNHGFIKLERVNLVVFDECHHAMKNHPYKKIMELIMDDDFCKPENRPHILGLTASVINKKCHHSKINENVKKLELVLNSSVETSLNHKDIYKFSTKPKEMIYVFQLKAHPCHLWIDYHILNPLNDVVKTLTSFALKNKICIDLTETDKDTLKSRFDLHVTLLRQLQSMTLLYGPWCALMAARIFNRDILEISKRAEEHDIKNAFSLIISTVTNIIVKLNPIITPEFGMKELILLSTTKLQTLVKILEIYATHPANTDPDNPKNVQSSQSTHGDNHTQKQFPKKRQFTAIIFVETRFTAIILNLYLNTVAKLSEKLSFIKSGYIIGHGMQSKKICRAAYMLHRSQQDVLNRLRRGELNILIGTKVVEEGIDVPKCNLVIRFDLPQNFRSYVQSKGRARAENSHYIMMVADASKKALFADLRDYARIELTLSEKCVDREGPDPKDSASYHKLDELIPPYQPIKGEGKPRVTMTSAISLVNWYCSRLPSDTFTSLHPKIKTKKVEVQRSKDKNVPAVLKFQTTIKLPINSVIKRPVIGPPMDCIKTAQMAAALKCCEVLHVAGELNDHLLPLSQECYATEKADLAETVPDGTPLPGTTKRKQLYFKKIAQCLKTALPLANVPCYMYEIDMILRTPTPALLNTHGRRLYHPEQYSRNLAILTRNKIPMIPEFSVYTRAGEVLITKKLKSDAVKLDESQLNKLVKFHQYIFNNVIRITSQDIFFDMAKSPTNILLTVIDKGQIDYDFIDYTFAKEIEPLPDLKTPERPMFEFSPEEFVDKVVTPIYRHFDRPMYFFVAELLTNMTPLSPFPQNGPNFLHVTDKIVEQNPNDTFESYYKAKYGINITNKTQFLLDVDHTVGRLNLLTPRFMTKQGTVLPSSSAETKALKQQDINQKQILVPELCRVHPFDTPLWHKTVCLPSILHRLNYFLVCDELRTLLARDVNLGPTDLVENCDMDSVNFDCFNVNAEDDGDSDVEETKEKNFYDKYPILDFGWRQVCDEQLQDLERPDDLQKLINGQKTTPNPLSQPNHSKKIKMSVTDSGMNTALTIAKVQDKTYKIIQQDMSYKPDLHNNNIHEDVHDIAKKKLIFKDERDTVSMDIEDSTNQNRNAVDISTPSSDPKLENGSMELDRKTPTDSVASNGNSEDTAVYNVIDHWFGKANECVDSDSVIEIPAVKIEPPPKTLVVCEENMPSVINHKNECNEKNQDVSVDTTTKKHSIVAIKKLWDHRLITMDIDETIENYQIKITIPKSSNAKPLAQYKQDSSIQVLPNSDPFSNMTVWEEPIGMSVIDEGKQLPALLDAPTEILNPYSPRNDEELPVENEKLAKSVSPMIVNENGFKNEEDLPGPAITTYRNLLKEEFEDYEDAEDETNIENFNQVEVLDKLVEAEETLSEVSFLSDECFADAVENMPDDLKKDTTGFKTTAIASNTEGSVKSPKSSNPVASQLEFEDSQDGRFSFLPAILHGIMSSNKNDIYSDYFDGLEPGRRKKPTSQLAGIHKQTLFTKPHSKGGATQVGDISEIIIDKDDQLKNGTSNIAPTLLQSVESLFDNPAKICPDLVDADNTNFLTDQQIHEADRGNLTESPTTEIDSNNTSTKTVADCEENPNADQTEKINVEITSSPLIQCDDKPRNLDPFGFNKNSDEHEIYKSFVKEPLPFTERDPRHAVYRYYITSDGLAVRKRISRCPDLGLLLRAITMSTSNDALDLERLELIGDSFLKMAVTVYLFCTEVDCHEGKLSFKRSKQVSNFKLYCLGKMHDLGPMLISSKFEPLENWLAPGYNSKNIDEKLKAAPVDSKIMHYDMRLQHLIPDKCLADCVESLIGTYLISCGALAALDFMQWLGIQIFNSQTIQASRDLLKLEDQLGPTLKDSLSLVKNEPVIAKSNNDLQITPASHRPQYVAEEDEKEEEDIDKMWAGLPHHLPPSPLLLSTPNFSEKLARLFPNIERFQEILNYKFKDPAYLIQALTHSSYTLHRLTDCYQRLEFLGDALLDYLITRHLYNLSDRFTPGQMTDLRSALVNNIIFASLAVKYGFHKYLLQCSPRLFASIDRFVRAQREKGPTGGKDTFNMGDNLFMSPSTPRRPKQKAAFSSPHGARQGSTSSSADYPITMTVKDVEVPKVLGDIFESVAGAIFMDSGMSLKTLWKVYSSLMRDEIDFYTKNIPLSPIRELLEMEPEKIRFLRPVKVDGHQVKVTVHVFGKGRWSGIGSNSKIAKCTAAKTALHFLKQKSQPSLTK